MTTAGPALACVEVASLARAYVMLDALVKRAQVTVITHRELTPGKSLILFAGDEESCLEAHSAALQASATSLIDDLLLPMAHPQIWAGLAGRLAPRRGEAAMIVEIETVASTLAALDAALKYTDVSLIKLRLAAGIGGRGLFVISGRLDEVEASTEAVERAVQRPERLIACEQVSQVHDELWGYFSAQDAAPY